MDTRINKTKFKYKLSHLQAICLYKKLLPKSQAVSWYSSLPALPDKTQCTLNLTLKTHDNTRNDKNRLQHNQLKMRRPHVTSEWNFHELHCHSTWIKKNPWTVNHVFHNLNKIAQKHNPTTPKKGEKSFASPLLYVVNSAIQGL